MASLYEERQDMLLSWSTKGCIEMTMKTPLFLSLAGLSLAFATPANAEPDGNVTYVIQPGDTLYDLAQDYLSDASEMGEVRSENGISRPRLLQIGQSITIPRRLLKFEPVSLSLRSFSGRVTVEKGGRAVAASEGQAVPEGAIVSTGANSFVAIGGEDGTVITLPSNSRIRIVDARRYAINDKIDVQVKVLKGRGTIRAPKIDGEARFRAGTPLAVTAVRGTEFRVAFIDDRGVSLTEVVEGEVAVQQGDEALITPSGFGVASTELGLADREALLEAPELIEGSKIQTAENITFAIAGIDGATAYRTQLARDAGFLEIIDENVSEAPEAVFAELEDGRYFVRARAIASSGLEGLAKPYNFRRKRVGASAGAEPSPLADTIKFAWQAQGKGESFHAFQLWRADAPQTLIIDEVGLTNSAILIGDIKPGKYVWRAATFLIDEGEVVKIWTPAQEIELTE